MKRSYFLLLLFLVFNISHAQNRPVQKPRLIVNIAVDGLRSDYLELFSNGFTNNGFKRLMSNGFYCKNMTFPYLSCGGAADYASVFTGTIPSDHGVSGDKYFDQKTKKELSCVFDTDKKGVAGKAFVSPKSLLTSTYTDELKLYTQGKSRIITIALNAEQAVMMAGHSGNGTVWMDNNSGEWMSSTFYGNVLPDWAIQANNISQVKNNLYRNWSNLYISSNYIANSSQTGVSPFFAYPMKETLGSNNSFEKYKLSPYANTAVRELALRAVKNEFVGIDEVPDVLNVQFSVRGFDQASAGVMTSEIQDMYLRVDREIKTLVEALDERCGENNVLYIVFSPQTEYVNPEKMSVYNIPTGYFIIDRSLSLLSTYLMAIYGQVDFIAGYSNRQLYLNKEAIAAKKLDIRKVEDDVAHFMGRFSGVQYAVRAEDLQQLSCDNIKVQKARNAFNRNKAGDIILFLLPGWVDVPNDTYKVGVSSRINNYAPFMISGWRVKKQIVEKPFSVIDVAPTICNMLNISYPNSSIGTPLLEVTY